MTSPGFLWRISRKNRIVTAEGMEVTPHDGGGGFLSCRRRRARRAGVPRRTAGRMSVGVSHTPRSPATRGGAGEETGEAALRAVVVAAGPGGRRED